MLSADDRDKVVKWSKRQLGTQARLAFISEKELSEHDEFVEKSGTGITSQDMERCQPLISIMANCIDNGSDDEDCHQESGAYSNSRTVSRCTPTIH